MAARTPLASYCTVQEAAGALAVDHKTIRRMIARGELPAVRVGARPAGAIRDTRPIRIPVDALAAALHPVADAHRAA
jgi:excisionase family DNA binding protein